MSSKLPSGKYFILNGKDYADRAKEEDFSLFPKPVICPTDSITKLWTVEALPNGHYVLEARGSPTGESDGHVHAFLTEHEKKREWVITLRPDQDNRYTIQEASGKGWMTTESDRGAPQKIAVGPLPTTKSDIPQYFDNALWTFLPQH